MTHTHTHSVRLFWGVGDRTSQRTLPDKKGHSQQTDRDDPDGIRTRNPNKRGASDPRLTSRGHRDLHLIILISFFYYFPAHLLESSALASFSMKMSNNKSLFLINECFFLLLKTKCFKGFITSSAQNVHFHLRVLPQKFRSVPTLQHTLQEF